MVYGPRLEIHLIALAIPPVVACALVGVAMLGHLSLCVAVVNRIHSVAIPRWGLRFCDFLWYLFTLGVPTAIGCWLMASEVTSRTLTFFAADVWAIGGYIVICWTAAVVGTAQLVWRQALSPSTWRLTANHTAQVDIVREIGQRPVGDLVTSLLSRLPGNEIFTLSVHEKTLTVPRLASELEELAIVHLSDLHFTGQLTRPFFHEVVRRANALDGDLVAITGDIIDKPQCLPWLGEVLGQLTSRYGTFFVLGNHDHRVRNDRVVREALTDAGLIDLGGRWQLINVRERPVVLAGNELPWYPAATMQDCPKMHDSRRPFRILLSHSPDQFPWARAYDFDLMLAGHTHGGQIRLPLIGPLLSPSRRGVQYASGAYFKSPTLLHVSRGLSGTRPVRFNCPPELTKLVLKTG